MDYLYYAKKYLINTYKHLPVVFTNAKGCKLYDVSNKEYLDFTSGIGVMALGHGNEKWIKAVEDQLEKLVHTSNIVLNIPVLKLAKKLTEISNMSKVFFCNSGTEANEGSIKLARKYSFEKYGKGRNTIITLDRSFHGRTMASLEATGEEELHKYFYPFPEGFKHIDITVEALEKAVDSTVCAIMIEAVQGEGGVNPLSKEFVSKVFEIAEKNDILVICDEVQCGLGRTGKLYGFNNYNVQPDIISVAKTLGGGLPMGAVLCNEKLKDTFKYGDHGSTFGGNPVCAAGAIEVLNEITDESFLAKVAEKGKFIKEFFKNNSSKNIKEVRGIGLMVGVEIKGKASEIQKKVFEKGLLVLTAGRDNVVRILPPLIITQEELEKGLNIIYEAIKSM
ncbi:aspartate aminotransferase family protein [Clostridium sp. WLY-B-L2]|uniref:Acetylornithine aminotransferase n=1 Tax=Clostridium aromativorans TaxID=2836848 RepID=A0ABS8N6T0_9CLOT|nr:MULTISPECIES: aspartate aminotransferase family protein [Clostridium]KAA8668055.1 aspartate aminotransferase family protein [Clostridium sp. HV4-5-A1G]MCC9295485.1 aspartate aminotransferase family protein [Clostridium aromativorans]